MKVLILTGETRISNSDVSYNGGGWVGSLLNSFAVCGVLNNTLNLGVVTASKRETHEYKSGIEYFSIIGLRRTSLFYNKKTEGFIARVMKVVEIFKPNIIQVFGSEREWGLIAKYTNIPVVLHLQGVLTTYFEAWLPQNISWINLYLKYPRQYILYRNLKSFIKREKDIFSIVRYYMGRTKWDRRCVELLSSECTYYHCDEVLRPEIYTSGKLWKYKGNKVTKIVSIISSPTYKGSDIILRTAKVLKDNNILDFKWYVYGLPNLEFAQWVTNIKPKTVNVEAKGIASSEKLIEAITDAEVFVHPSYIENSPNTVCEAQTLGIPVIATNGGGTCSLITHMMDGILVNVNDPYMTASYIKQVASDCELAQKLGINGRKRAMERHNPQSIVNSLIHIYEDIIQQSL